nr:hypothetical protein CFP56_67570 [Quercus suber]
MPADELSNGPPSLTLTNRHGYEWMYREYADELETSTERGRARTSTGGGEMSRGVGSWGRRFRCLENMTLGRDPAGEGKGRDRRDCGGMSMVPMGGRPVSAEKDDCQGSSEVAHGDAGKFKTMEVSCDSIKFVVETQLMSFHAHTLVVTHET